VFLRYLGVKET